MRQASLSAWAPDMLLLAGPETALSANCPALVRPAPPPGKGIRAILTFKVIFSKILLSVLDWTLCVTRVCFAAQRTLPIHVSARAISLGSEERQCVYGKAAVRTFQ
jgi:hypothetical protein